MAGETSTSQSVQRVYDSGLCMQCGTCVAMCPTAAVDLAWDLRLGYRLHVRESACDGCGVCLAVCPGEGLDFTPGARWRERNDGAPAADFLGPWSSLWFGWAVDTEVRHAGASGGVATAILQGELAEGLVDHVIAVRMDPANALASETLVVGSAEDVAACRGSRYNVAAVNVALRRVLDEPGRYALVGLPCHVQGLRLAQARSRRLRERVALALGIFCGLTCEPRATDVKARRLGVDPRDLVDVRYRGPGWPGGLRLVTRRGRVTEQPYPAYYDRLMAAYVPPRCRICPDALAELADVSVGDAWLDRFAGSDGVSDVIARTPAGEDVVARLRPRWLALSAASPREMVASQAETYRVKRPLCRGRLWWRGRRGRAIPAYPGLDLSASPGDRLAALADIAQEAFFRTAGDRRYPLKG